MRGSSKPKPPNGLLAQDRGPGVDGTASIGGGTDTGFVIAATTRAFVNEGTARSRRSVALRFVGERIKIVNDGTIVGEKTALVLDGAVNIVNSGVIDGDVQAQGRRGQL